MNWYNYIADFFSGAFIVNTIPHLVSGLSGNKFPTPFSKPPGKGLSSPVINTWWGLLNLVIGFLLFKAGKISIDCPWRLVIFFIGFGVLGLMLSKNFGGKMKE